MPPHTEAGHLKLLGPNLPGAVPSTLPNPTFTSTLGQGFGKNGPGGSCKERARLGGSLLVVGEPGGRRNRGNRVFGPTQ